MSLAKWAALAALGYAGLYAFKWSASNMQTLSPSDFREWWPAVNRDLAERADAFATRVAEEGGRAYVSPAPGAIGRVAGGSSQHDMVTHGEVRAVDMMLEGITLQRAYEIARGVGFTGIGVYPDWQPSHGVHLDVRPGRDYGDPAQWAGIDTAGGQGYVGIGQVIQA